MLSTSGLVATVMLIYRTGILLRSSKKISGITAISSTLANAGMASPYSFCVGISFL